MSVLVFGGPSDYNYPEIAEGAGVEVLRYLVLSDNMDLKQWALGGYTRLCGISFNCDSCGNTISGLRWHCSTCEDYDLCNDCG